MSRKISDPLSAAVKPVPAYQTGRRVAGRAERDLGRIILSAVLSEEFVSIGKVCFKNGIRPAFGPDPEAPGEGV